MNEHHNLFSALAAALAPFLIAELAKHSGGTQGNPAMQNTGIQPQGQLGQNFGGQPQQTVNGFVGNQQAQNTQAGGMFGGQPQQAAQPTVTPDMIQTLITPLVQNDQIKAALTAQMQQMGIANLPDARPEQLPELYQRFQTVEQQARAAGLLGQPQNGTPSII